MYKWTYVPTAIANTNIKAPKLILADNYLIINSIAQAYTASVYDINGKEIARQAINAGNEFRISTLHLAPGMYIVKLQNNDANYSYKFIK